MNNRSICQALGAVLLTLIAILLASPPTLGLVQDPGALKSLMLDYLTVPQNREKVRRALRENLPPDIKAEQRKINGHINQQIHQILSSSTRLSESDGQVSGPRDAPLQIVEFSSLNCLHSRESEATLHGFIQKHPELIRHVYKSYYDLKNSVVPTAAHIALAAADLGKFNEMKERLFEHQGELNYAVYKRIAEDIGLDFKELDQKYRSNLGAHDRVLKANLEEARRLNINATPTFFINGVRIDGALTTSFLEMLVAER